MPERAEIVSYLEACTAAEVDTLLKEARPEPNPTSKFEQGKQLFADRHGRKGSTK
ncbi:hypothetical protein [Antrihabitans sp. YC2-6]|uniref:hypothetical protein n=1 Tax=Antrihabitans sp. YC2-6 TaxID=2799498 RepID=UPI0018F6B80F|nr:hypothetical protein [Antrihabitans sp. YC2-6]MBJ8344831.1 hypothetical protein [Antrihabitans sp. YC2-6]